MLSNRKDMLKLNVYKTTYAGVQTEITCLVTLIFHLFIWIIQKVSVQFDLDGGRQLCVSMFCKSCWIRNVLLNIENIGIKIMKDFLKKEFKNAESQSICCLTDMLCFHIFNVSYHDTMRNSISFSCVLFLFVF